MGIFSGWSSNKKRIKEYVEYLKITNDKEMATHLAMAVVVRYILKGYNNDGFNEILGGERIFQYTKGSMVLGDATAFILMFPLNSGIQEKAIAGDFQSNLFLSGLAVWKMTLYCLEAKPGKNINTEFYILGRQMWNELKRGFDGVDAALLYIENNALEPHDKWIKENSRWIPEMFDMEKTIYKMKEGR
jgi:hypothetical protein